MFLEKYAKARLQKQAAAADVLNSIKDWIHSPAGRDMLKRLAIGGGTALAVQGATSLVDPEGKHKGKRAAASILAGLLAGYKGPEAYAWGKQAFNKGPREAWRQFKMVGLEGGTPEDADRIDARRIAADKEVAAQEAALAKEYQEGQAKKLINRGLEFVDKSGKLRARRQAEEARDAADRAKMIAQVNQFSKALGLQRTLHSRANTGFNSNNADIAYTLNTLGMDLPEDLANIPGWRDKYIEGGLDRNADSMARGEEKYLANLGKDKPNAIEGVDYNRR